MASGDGHTGFYIRHIICIREFLGRNWRAFRRVDVLNTLGASKGAILTPRSRPALAANWRVIMKTNFPRIKKFVQKSTFRRRMFFVVFLPLVFVISAAMTFFEAGRLAARHIYEECRAGIYWVKRGW